MIAIFTNNKTIHWHLGQDKPDIKDYEIESVYADEEELLYILVNFSNIPFRPRSKSMKWYGDWAKLIWGNL